MHVFQKRLTFSCIITLILQLQLTLNTAGNNTKDFRVVPWKLLLLETVFTFNSYYVVKKAE